MSPLSTTTVPVSSSERIGELDVLRGFALLGVFIVHCVSSLYYLYPVGDTVYATWEENPFQFGMLLLCEVLFYDKAVTLFSVLFGIGFWVQMGRLKARGGDFNRLYIRRLMVLLGFGLINKFLLFPGDILVDYALLGFVLFMLRDVSSRTMLVVGMLLLFIISQLAYGLIDPSWVNHDALDEMLEKALLSDNYADWVIQLSHWHIQENIIALGMIPLAFYILARFLLGAWIARNQLIQRARQAVPHVKRIALVCVPTGIVFEVLSVAQWGEVLELPEFYGYAFHAIGVPLLALGYACVLIILCNSDRWRWITRVFSPVGRMALTAYITHGILILIFIHPFGIYIRPDISPALGWLVAMIMFLGLSLFSHYWLKLFQFGPLEWLWRSLTYGEFQPMSKKPIR